MPVRIGIDASALPSKMAGVGRYICGLVSALSKVDESNRYFLFLKRKDRKFFKNLGANFHLIELPDFSRPVRMGWQMFAPQHLARRYQLDVWHSPHYVLPIGLQNVRTVVTFHDMTFFLMPKLYAATKRLYFQSTIKKAAFRADRIVAISQTTKEDITNLFPDLNGDRLSLVYSGTNGMFKPVKDDFEINRVKTELGTGNKFVLFVGTLEKRKNLAVLLRAFHKLIRNGHRGTRLVLVGQAENAFVETKQAISTLGLSGEVLLPGYLADAKLPALYSAASLFVYPSQYEGFGFPVLEAMACGAPVLTSDNSAMREISGMPLMQIAPNDVSEWAERMHRLLSDKPLRQHLVHHGLERARQFTWTKTAEQMVEIYTRGKEKPKRRPVVVATGNALFARRQQESVFESMPTLSSVANAILHTLVYSDIFDYPLTKNEIYLGLVNTISSKEKIADILGNGALKPHVESQDEYYFLKDRARLVQIRRQRKHLSKALLHKNQRVLRFICAFPFVRMVAFSGSIAFCNCQHDDDIDLFLIVHSRRIWFVYTALAMILKMIGKRTLFCINYLYGKSDLTIGERDFFIAHQIANLRVISGKNVYRHFVDANKWVLNYLPQSRIETTSFEYLDNEIGAACADESTPGRMKKLFEKVFGWHGFDRLEDIVFRLYSGHIRRRTHGMNGSVTVDKDEIRLFTNDHRHHLLQELQKRMQRLEESQ